MKVLVCGGRDFTDFDWAFAELDALDELNEITMIIHGDAKGADTAGKGWAFTHQRPYLSVPAEWNRYGKSAGFKRNAKMLEYGPDLVLALPGGKGTKMMCDLARRKGFNVKELHQEESYP